MTVAGEHIRSLHILSLTDTVTVQLTQKGIRRKKLKMWDTNTTKDPIILISPSFGTGYTFSTVSLHRQALPAIQGEKKELERGKEGGHIVIAEKGGRGRPIKR
jgi:hypothetical protein